MRLWALILAGVAAYAAPTISNAAVDNITAHGARFAWDTNVASTTAKIKVGTADPPTTVILPLNDGSFTTHVWFASGLTAGTLYYWQVCSTNAGETCTASQTFTTLAAASGIATLPTAPTPVTTTYPASFANTYTVASDCSDLTTKLTTAAAQDGSLNYLVTIPAGTECVGRYTLPAKTGANPNGAGFIVLQSGGTLAPAGSQTTAAYGASAAAIIANYLQTYYQASDPATCNSGDILVRTDTLAIKYCTAANTWTAQTVTTGSGAPSSTCTANAWYRDTSEADTHKAFWWCTATNKNRNVYVDSSNNYVNWAGLYTAGSTKGYRIVGLRIQDLERPTAYTNLLSTSSGSGDEIGSRSFCLAYTQSTDSYIFWDRVYFDGQGQPHRQQEAICFADGANMAVVDSYFNEINVWRPTGASESTAHAVFFLNGPGPFKFNNNRCQNVLGMCVFHSDDNPVGQTNDVTITNNYMYVAPGYNTAEPVNLGRLYYFRHHIELKRGQRYLIKGNTFNGGFPSANPSAAAIGLTPRNGSSTSTQCRTNTIRISDVNIESNLYLYVPQGGLFTGHNDGANCNTYNTIRVAILNNAIYTIGQSSTGVNTGPGIYTYNGQFADSGLGFEDFTIGNNVISQPSSYTSEANVWTFAGDFASYPNSRFNFYSNMYFGSNIEYTWGLKWSGTASYGTAALNALIIPNSTYSYLGNARQRGKTGGLDNNPTYPTGSYSSQDPAAFSGAVYTCSYCSAPYALFPKFGGILAAAGSARGANGDDNGPDWVAFDQAQGNLRNLRVIANTAYWTAYDSTTACTVEYGTSATPGTGSRLTDTPTSRFRSLALTGLGAGTTYYVRLYCGGSLSTSFVAQ